MTLSYVEQQTLYTQGGSVQYKSDTSVFYEDLHEKFPVDDYTISSVNFDTPLMFNDETLIFSFYVTNGDNYGTSGRAIFIQIPIGAAPIVLANIPPIGRVAAFEYPGENKNLYAKVDDEWKLVAPIASNMVFLDRTFKRLQELAIVDGTIEDGEILIRRIL